MARKTQKSKKKNPSNRLSPKQKQDGIMREFLNQITRAAYLVALSLGFRGSFVKFLSELQEALTEVIRQDENKRPTTRTQST